MSYKEYIKQRILPTFCILVTVLNVFIWFCGYLLSDTDEYYVLLSPLIYGFIGVIPSLFTYTKKERVGRRVIIEIVVEIVSLNALILGFSYGMGVFHRFETGAIISIGIFVIYFLIRFIWWRVEVRTARELTKALEKIDEN